MGMGTEYRRKSDFELMALVGGDDIEAFAELVRRYQDPLVNFFYRYAWDRFLAEDCAQEVLIRVFRASKSYAPTASFKTYLFSIARNFWIDHLRSSRAGREISLQSAVDGDETVLGDLVESQERDPGDGLGGRETGEIIRNAIDSLPEDQKSVFVLCQVEGMKYSDAAGILGIPLGTVKSRMHAAVEKLKSLLKGKVV